MASRSLNRVILIGNLTRDPELKYTPNGTAVCTFGVATNRSWTTSDGQTKEEAQYHRIVAWQKLAELCGKLLLKGKKVYLEGRITYRTFTGRDGMQRTITEIVLDDFIVFDSRRAAVSEESKSEEVKEKISLAVEPTLPEEKNATKAKAQKETESEENQKSVEPTAKEDVKPEDIPF